MAQRFIQRTSSGFITFLCSGSPVRKTHAVVASSATALNDHASWNRLLPWDMKHIAKFLQHHSKYFHTSAIFQCRHGNDMDHKSTNSWTTITFTEGFARNIRRTVSIAIRNACFYWIILQMRVPIFWRKSSLANSCNRNWDAVSFLSRDVAK